ncbi:MAG: hypothetical protein K0B07_02630 [DPANN group archaeon]|nr:hypothetical protein [DPANN group archaeon]
MSLFTDHKDFYNQVLSLGDGKERFIGLVSKIYSHLEDEQIFELYSIAKQNIYDNLDDIGENEIFSSIVLNVSKLLLNKKLESYDKALSELITDEIIDNYIIEIQLSNREKRLRDKLYTIKKTKGIDSETIYQQELYNKALERFIPRISSIGTPYNVNDLEKSVLKYFRESTPVKQAMFHTIIPADKKNNISLLAEHYRHHETEKNSKLLLKIKEGFLRYLSESPLKYKQINSLAEKVEKTLQFQEAQEQIQDDDWDLTEKVIDFIYPTTIDSNPQDFFNSPDVRKYLTPTRFKTGKLYVHALKESEEIRLMAEYLIENISKGRIKITQEHELDKQVQILMPKKSADKVSAALSVALTE